MITKKKQYSDEVVEVDCVLRRTSEKAFGIVIDPEDNYSDRDKENIIWIPKSICEMNKHHFHVANVAKVPRWFAEKEGMV